MRITGSRKTNKHFVSQGFGYDTNRIKSSHQTAMGSIVSILPKDHFQLLTFQSMSMRYEIDSSMFFSLAFAVMNEKLTVFQ